MISCFFSVVIGNYNNNCSTIPNFKSTETRQSKEFEVQKQTEKMRRKFLDTGNETIQHSEKNDRQLTEQKASDANVYDLFFTDATINLTATMSLGRVLM